VQISAEKWSSNKKEQSIRSDNSVSMSPTQTQKTFVVHRLQQNEGALPSH